MRTERKKPFDAVRRGPGGATGGEDRYRRETFVAPREEAREKVREFWRRYPREAYGSEIEFWQELDDGRIEVTMRRFPTAD